MRSNRIEKRKKKKLKGKDRKRDSEIANEKKNHSLEEKKTTTKE